MGFNVGGLASGAASRSREGEFLAGMKSGVLVIKNVETFDGHGGDKFQITGVVKSGVEAPEQLGKKETQAHVGDVVVAQQDPDAEGGAGRIIGDLESILGPNLPAAVKGDTNPPTHPDNLKRLAAFNALLRADGNGFTKSGTPCPAAGYELKFTCNKVKTKKGEYIYPPKFTHVEMTSEQAASNVKEYLGG